MLVERVDRRDWLMLSSTPPVRQQLIVVQLSPPADQPDGSRRKVSGEHRAIDSYRRAAPVVLSMEVGDRVVALVPVHANHDAVEGADPRHQAPSLDAVGSSDGRANASAIRSASPSRGA